MKMSYSREEDILLIETAAGDIDHAEEMGRFIVHFDLSNKPVVIEIQGASEFLSLATQSSIKAEPLEFN